MMFGQLREHVPKCKGPAQVIEEKARYLIADDDGQENL